MMPTRTTRDGVVMPALIYGTAWKKESTSSLVAMAIRSGFRGIDTACQPKHYHEAGVGEALSLLCNEGVDKEALFLQTKFTPLAGHDPLRIPYDPTAPLATQVHDSFHVSQRNLGRSCIDSYVLHSPLYPFRDLATVWKAMEEIFERGDVRQLGLSNCYDVEILERLAREKFHLPAVIQNRFYRETGYDKDIRAWCDDHGVLYQSFWSLTANPHLLNSRPIIALAQAYGVEPPQIWYRFLTQKGLTPLIGSTSQEHLKADLGIFDFSLSDDEMVRIEDLL